MENLDAAVGRHQMLTESVLLSVLDVRFKYAALRASYYGEHGATANWILPKRV